MKEYYADSKKVVLFVGNRLIKKMIKKNKKHKRIMTADYKSGMSNQALAYCLINTMVGLLSQVRVCWPVLGTTKPGV